MGMRFMAAHPNSLSHWMASAGSSLTNCTYQADKEINPDQAKEEIMTTNSEEITFSKYTKCNFISVWVKYDLIFIEYKMR